MDADDLMDERLRVAGARWRESNTGVAQADLPAAAPPRRSNSPRHWAPLLSAAVLTAVLVMGGWFVLNRNDSTPSADDTPALSATVWQLLGYGQQSDTGSSATLYIDPAGHLVADDDCALIVGKAHIDGASLRVADLAIRYKSCTDQNGAAFAPSGADILRGPATYKITSATLTINRSGKPPMHLRRAASSALRPTADYPTLVGADWRLAAYTTAAGKRTPARVDATLQIADDLTLGASDGCNGLSGPVTLPSGELRFGDLITTEIGCTGTTETTSSAVDAVMRGSVAAVVQGNQLTLTKTGVGTLIYLWQPQDAALTDSTSLVGRTWRLASVAGDPAAATTATLSISGKRIVVADGCRDMVGSVAVSAGGLEIAGLPASRPGCGGLIGNQAVTIDSFVRNGGISWSIRDGELIVPGGGAQSFALVFRSVAAPVDRATQLVGPTWRLTQYERTTAGTSSGSSVATKITLNFDGKGRYASNQHCESRSGAATLGAATVLFTPGHSTVNVGRCISHTSDRSYAVVDDAVDSVLRGQTTWTLRGSQLTITKDGVGALTYRRS